MTYFNKPETLADLKKQYRELAHKHHPDNGGDGDTMKAINAEYERLFPKLKDVRQTADGKTYTKENAETANQFIDLIDRLMRMEGLVIEIIGCFVYEIFKPPKLVGLTEMSKLLGKKVFAELLDPLIRRPPPKPTLVPESDKRPAITKISAAEDFSDLEETGGNQNA